MKLIFQLRFRTNYGQSLWLAAKLPAPANGHSETELPLEYLNAEYWQTAVSVSDRDAVDGRMTYHYLLRNADGSTISDWGHGRVIDAADLDRGELLVVDSWNHPGFFENAFYTEPFRQVLLQSRFTEARCAAPSTPTHTFKIKAPLLEYGQTLCLLGEGAVLGNWSTAAPLLLNRVAGEDFLSVQLDLGRQHFPLAYKYGVYDLENHRFIRYENGPNRILHDTLAPGRRTLVNDGFVALPADTWRGAGVAVPLFSLRSERSFGVGEFPDLKLLADWGRLVGLKLIQILPINDTTATHSWLDCYPYAAISAFALHPVYLNLERIAAGPNKHLLTGLEPERKRLNALDVVDYEAVIKAKSGFIRQIYPLQKRPTFESGEYQRFFADNRHWLEPYAVFCYWRDRYGTADFHQWPAHRRYRADEAAALIAAKSSAFNEIALHYFVQYHLHLQLREAVEYVHRQGLVLKGDIPIGVSPRGADAWQQPELYHLDLQTGAPPDAFAAKGQNWSFPTYNWTRMKQDGFVWWKQRFEQMSRYFDAFRIDHVLGFFRIWSIPAHAVEGIMGFFVPAIPVDRDEFGRRGIRFDGERFTRPYINDAVLRDTFGDDHEAVRREFLSRDSSGNYSLKTEFATQRQVERHFAALPPDQRNLKLQAGLYDLISNVILFEDRDLPEQHFHFRFAMDATSSFRSLPGNTRAQLWDLYVDYFFRRQDNFWRLEAMQKLPALKRVTNMLVCGEDLGLVPDCVPDVLKQLGLLCLEVQRMPKRLNQEFSRPQDAPYLSVVTPATHDMSTIRGWWEEDPPRTQKFYSQELGQAGAAPSQCAGWINQAIILQHLLSPAMWSIFQWQDLLGMDVQLRWPDPAAERINVPANPHHYWRYRMHLTLERLLQADDFNRRLKECIQLSGR